MFPILIYFLFLNVSPEDDDLADEIAIPDGKIGAKKRRKLEMKAEKKKEREVIFFLVIS